MNSIRRLALLGGFGLALIGVGLFFAFRGPSTASATFVAPTFSLPGLRDGEASVDLAAYRGRPVVLNFFFSSCKPCIDEMPLFEAEAKRRGDDVVFIGIDHFEPRADGQRIVKLTKVTYRIAWDETGVVAPQFGAIAFPTTVFIDADGVVRKRFVAPLTASALTRNIDIVSRRA